MNLENIRYFLRIHSQKENSYGQHGELQQAEIAKHCLYKSSCNDVLLVFESQTSNFSSL